MGHKVVRQSRNDDGIVWFQNDVNGFFVKNGGFFEGASDYCEGAGVALVAKTLSKKNTGEQGVHSAMQWTKAGGRESPQQQILCHSHESVEMDEEMDGEVEGGKGNPEPLCFLDDFTLGGRMRNLKTIPAGREQNFLRALEHRHRQTQRHRIGRLNF